MEIKNRSAFFHYAIEQTFTAGISLVGSEVKSIRAGKVSFNDSYCSFIKEELWLKHLHIAPFNMQNSFSTIDTTRDRKLLLKRTELKKLKTKVQQKGYSIIPLKLHLTKTHFFKLDIGVAKGKKSVDKRQYLKEKQLKKDINRYIKN